LKFLDAVDALGLPKFPSYGAAWWQMAASVDCWEIHGLVTIKGIYHNNDDNNSNNNNDNDNIYICIYSLYNIIYIYCIWKYWKIYEHDRQLWNIDRSHHKCPYLMGERPMVPFRKYANDWFSCSMYHLWLYKSEQFL